MKSFITISLCLLLSTTILARFHTPVEPEIPSKPEEQEEISNEIEQPEISNYQRSPCYTCYSDCKHKAAETCYHTCPRKYRLSTLISMCYEMCLLGSLDRCMREGECFQRKEIESLTNVRGSISADAADKYMEDIRNILKRFEIPR